VSEGWRARQNSVCVSRRRSRRTSVAGVATSRSEVARPAGLEPATPGLEVPRKEATGGSAKPLPLILLPFCQTPDHSRLPRAATHCQSFVSRLSPLAVRSRDPRASWFRDHEGSGDSIAELVNDVDDRLAECTSYASRESNQDDSSRLQSPAYVSRPKSLSSVKRMRDSEWANARMTSSSTPGLISTMTDTSWPAAARRAVTTMKSHSRQRGTAPATLGGR
jgi:hypothetical protein